MIFIKYIIFADLKLEEILIRLIQLAENTVMVVVVKSKLFNAKATAQNRTKHQRVG